MEDLCKTNYLEPDETDKYNGILQELKGGQLWDSTQTESYIKISFEDWAEEMVMAKEDLEEYRLSKQPRPVVKAPTKSLPHKVAPPRVE